MNRLRRLLRFYGRTGRTYWRYAAPLLLLATIVFVPLGLIEALVAELDLESLDLGSGIKVAALLAAVSLLTATSLIGEVFYSGVVAFSLSHPEHGHSPPISDIARNLKYGRLIAVDIIYVILVVVGLVVLLVPGVVMFVWFGLSGPVVELEDRTVRGALARSFDLVRGNFWFVFWVLAPIEVIGDALTEALESLAHTLLGHSFIAEWAAGSVSNVFLTPVFAVAAVLLALDLIAAKDENALAPGRSPSPSPAPA